MKRFKFFALCFVLLFTSTTFVNAKENEEEIDSIVLISPEFQDAYIGQETLNLKNVKLKMLTVK